VRIRPGLVAFWTDLFPGSSKFVFLLGSFACPRTGIEKVAFFTISSQTKWAQIAPHKDEMVKIPRGTVDFLPSLSFIQCFHEVHTLSVESFHERDREGFINFRGDLPQYLPMIREILSRSELLDDYSIEVASNAMDGTY
jgi:hypothetical protein